MDYLREIRPSDKALKVFEKEVIERFNRRYAELASLKKRCLTEIAELEKQKEKIIGMMSRETISEQDGKKMLEKINAGLEEKSMMAASADGNYDIQEYWSEAREFISHMDEVWEKGDLNLKQRGQGLIMPKGFIFENNFIKPLENPHFISVFTPNCTLFQNKLPGLGSNQQP